MKKIYSLSIAIIVSANAFTQNVGINATGAAPNASAMLDIAATNKGLLIPRVALTSTTSNAPIGAGIVYSLLVYNTATAGTAPNNVTPGYYYWNGTRWVRLLNNTGNNGTAWLTTGNAGTTSGTNFIGTTNAQALDFRTNNITRFRIANGNQVHAVVDGTATLPFYSFTNNTGIGMWRAGNNILAFSTAGVERARIDANGSVGIGTTTPSISIGGLSTIIRLSVTGSGVSNSTIVENTNTANDGITTLIVQTNSSYLTNNFVGGLNATSNGGSSAVFGLCTPTSNNDNIGVRGAGNNSNNVAVRGSIPTTGPWMGFGGLFSGGLGYVNGLYNLSDKRVKKDINEIKNPIEIINNLKGITYKYDTSVLKNSAGDDKTYFGFIAQEVAITLPEITAVKRIPLGNNQPITYNSTENEVLNDAMVIDYIQVIPILVEAIKKQQKTIEDQDKKIESIQKELFELKNLIKNKE